MRSSANRSLILLFFVLVMFLANLRIGYADGVTVTLNVSPNPAQVGQDITFSGKANSGDSINIDGFSAPGCTGLLLGSLGTGTASAGAFSIVKAGGLPAGSYSAIANDLTSQTNSGCVNFTVTAPIPEYPLGLPILATLMLVGYGLVRRRAKHAT